MICQCERCKQEKECKYYGRPADPSATNGSDVQNGEWLCEPCVPLRYDELGEAILKMKEALGG